MVSVSGYLIGSQEAGKMPLPPQAELQWWYQFYFATERGRAGYEKYRDDFAKLIWKIASPNWKFDDATFVRSAASLANSDHVDIVIHNYRWRLGLAEGEARYPLCDDAISRSRFNRIRDFDLQSVSELLNQGIADTSVSVDRYRFVPCDPARSAISQYSNDV